MQLLFVYLSVIASQKHIYVLINACFEFFDLFIAEHPGNVVEHKIHILSDIYYLHTGPSYDRMCRIGNALSQCLETVVGTLDSEAGAIWLLDKKTQQLTPMFHIGPADISNISIENGSGIEGDVTKSGKSVIITDFAGDSRYDSTVFEENGLPVKGMLCVPLNNLHEVIGCVQIVNKKDGSFYDKEELLLCEHMAALAAITIDEKGLSTDTSEQKEILASLRNVTKEFPSGNGVIQVLRTG